MTLERLLMTAAHRTLSLMWRVLRPRVEGVHALVVTPDRKVVLVRHTYRTGWYLPSGGVKKGEQPEQAIVRELGEEIGLSSFGALVNAGRYENRPDHRRGQLTFFILEDARYRFRPSLEIESAAEFDPWSLPPDCANLACKRIGEWREGRPFGHDW